MHRQIKGLFRSCITLSTLPTSWHHTGNDRDRVGASMCMCRERERGIHSFRARRGRERERCTHPGPSGWTCRCGSWCLCSRRRTWSRRTPGSGSPGRRLRSSTGTPRVGGRARAPGARPRAPGGKPPGSAGWPRAPGGRPRGCAGKWARPAAGPRAPGRPPRAGGSPCWRSAPGSGRSAGSSGGAGSRSPPPRGSRPGATWIQRGAISEWTWCFSFFGLSRREERGEEEAEEEEEKPGWMLGWEALHTERERERGSRGDGERQSGCDAHSGLSGHLFTLYKDIRAWRGATPGAAIHQSGVGPSQLHQPSPLLGAEPEQHYLPTSTRGGGGGGGRGGLFWDFTLLIFNVLFLSQEIPAGEEKGGLWRSRNEWLTVRKFERNGPKIPFMGVFKTCSDLTPTLWQGLKSGSCSN